MAIDDSEPGPHLVCSVVTTSSEALRFDPPWRTSTVLALAEVILREGTFDARPILADALEDSGCDNSFILDHCRHTTSHEAGCWVLPLMLAEVPQLPAKQASVFVEAAWRWDDISEKHDPVHSGLFCSYLLVALLVSFAAGITTTKDAGLAWIVMAITLSGLLLIFLVALYGYHLFAVISRER